MLAVGRAPKRPTGEDLLDYLGTLATEYRAFFAGAERPLVGMLKEVVRYIGRAVNDGQRFRKAALRLPRSTDILLFAEETLGGMSAEELDLDARGTIGLERSGSAETIDSQPGRG